jgi:amidase
MNKLFGLFFLSILALAACSKVPDAPVHIELDIESLQAMMERGDLTSKQLTQYYLDRIETFDRNGPTLQSIIELNPDALAIAEALDQERVNLGSRGPMHGIPVVVKANIDTADKMDTTAGSLAMIGHKAPADAFIVAQLRAAGAVILAKANLSEWANMRSTSSSSGWSSIGGQTRNPYDVTRTPCGSSSGSAVAVAADLTSVAIGTETDGSIVCPASANGIVGIKPTLGLVSRSGIIPIAHSQDTAGPMARTVQDAAILLNAMVGQDRNDLLADDFPTEVPDFTAGLSPDALNGARIGVIRNYPGLGDDKKVDAKFDESVEQLRALGAEIIDPVEIDIQGMGESEGLVLRYEFKADLNAYLKQSGAPVSTLAELIAFNKAHADKVMPYFQQELLEQTELKGPLTDYEYIEALATSKRVSQQGIDSVMNKYTLDALVAPTLGIADKIDHKHGESLPGPYTASYAAVAGYPSITVPSGYVSDLPINISFIGGAFSDARLIGYAFAFEQATQVRRPPQLEK